MRLDSKFFIESWNVHERCMREEPCTINSLEAFHSTLIKAVSSNHPTDTLKKKTYWPKKKITQVETRRESISKEKVKGLQQVHPASGTEI